MGLKLTQTWKQSRETNKSPDKRFEQKQRSFVSFLDFLATTKKTRSVETFQDLNFRLHIILVILITLRSLVRYTLVFSIRPGCPRLLEFEKKRVMVV